MNYREYINNKFSDSGVDLIEYDLNSQAVNYIASRNNKKISFDVHFNEIGFVTRVNNTYIHNGDEKVKLCGDYDVPNNSFNLKLECECLFKGYIDNVINNFR